MKKTDIALILGVIVVIIISIFAFSGSSQKIEKVCDRQREGDNLEGGKAICSARLEHPAVLHQV